MKPTKSVSLSSQAPYSLLLNTLIIFKSVNTVNLLQSVSIQFVDSGRCHVLKLKTLLKLHKSEYKFPWNLLVLENAFYLIALV